MKFANRRHCPQLPPLHARRGTALLGAPAAGRVAGQPLTHGLEAVKTKTMS